MILAIDPGNKESGYCFLNKDYTPRIFDKVDNETLRDLLRFYLTTGMITEAVIEKVASYGMPVGETVFDTCIWIGRFTELLHTCDIPVEYVRRKEYVVDLCGSPKAKDSNVIQYLIDRFASDTPNHGKGTKSDPGWFYGFKKDVWQAYAIGVWYLDKS